MRNVGKGVQKKDAMALVTGKPVYTDDLAPKDCLIVKVLHSPHAFAKIKSINTTIAKKIPGIEAVFTYEDVPKARFTMAGQTYPELSPYDRYILEDVVRYVGDDVAIVAGIDEDCVDRALKAIKVDYEVLEPVLDFTKALDNPSIIHPEKDYKCLIPIGNEVKRNLVASGVTYAGDVDEAFEESDVILEREYHTKANAQAMMETMRAYSYIDTYGRLNCVSSTQIPFHVRRILSNALQIPKSKINVIKPRIGGGFGGKQTACLEIFTAFVTWKLKKPSKIVYSRKETFQSSNSRHEMKVRVKLGAKKDGTIMAIDLYALSNQGAYGEHGPTTVGLTGHKSLPIYNHVKATKFSYDVVYTNTMRAGAFRGYGATQGLFALESAVNELADELGMDPIEIRQKNMVRENEILPQYHDEYLNACALDQCVDRVMEMTDYKNKPLRRDMGDFVRGIGVSLAMQGSGVAGVDVGSAEIKLQDDGYYILSIGATDMGTGCDTILAQIAAECLECDVNQVITNALDTDHAPYDSGSYASSTTYITGMAVVKACRKLRQDMIETVADYWQVDPQQIYFDGSHISMFDASKTMALKELSDLCFNGAIHKALIATDTHYSPTSPPPFMAAICEVDVDKLTGEITVHDYAACVDCGTIINPTLARVQTEGGIMQGIGMALYEDISYSKEGKMRNHNFLQYKIPTRLDAKNIRVDFRSSYEDNGPYGAKSIGEIVINTPNAAIASAVAHATGHYVRTLPITPEKALMGEDE